MTRWKQERKTIILIVPHLYYWTILYQRHQLSDPINKKKIFLTLNQRMFVLGLRWFLFGMSRNKLRCKAVNCIVNIPQPVIFKLALCPRILKQKKKVDRTCLMLSLYFHPIYPQLWKAENSLIRLIRGLQSRFVRFMSRTLMTTCCAYARGCKDAPRLPDSCR